MPYRQIKIHPMRLSVNPSPSPDSNPAKYPGNSRYPIARKKPMSYTNILILINIAFFIVVVSLLPFLGEEKFIEFFRQNIALSPATFSQHPWTLITSMFMHAPSSSGYPFTLFSMHLFVNMISLLFLGNFLEKIIGSKRFIKLYLAGGIAGSLFLLLLYSISSDPRIISLTFFTSSAINSVVEISAVGASAAIFALAGCLAVLVPKMRVIVFFVIPMPIWIAVIFLVAAMSIIPGIANSAHVGGLLAGVVYAFYLRHKYQKKVQTINKMMMFN